jgi:hypothetical protein
MEELRWVRVMQTPTWTPRVCYDGALRRREVFPLDLHVAWVPAVIREDVLHRGASSLFHVQTNTSIVSSSHKLADLTSNEYSILYIRLSGRVDLGDNL